MLIKASLKEEGGCWCFPALIRLTTVTGKVSSSKACHPPLSIHGQDDYIVAKSRASEEQAWAPITQPARGSHEAHEAWCCRPGVITQGTSVLPSVLSSHRCSVPTGVCLAACQLFKQAPPPSMAGLPGLQYSSPSAPVNGTAAQARLQKHRRKIEEAKSWESLFPLRFVQSGVSAGKELIECIYRRGNQLTYTAESG